MQVVEHQLPLLGKIELIDCNRLLVIMWFLVGAVFFFLLVCLGWAVLFYCGNPLTFNIIT